MGTPPHPSNLGKVNPPQEGERVIQLPTRTLWLKLVCCSLGMTLLTGDYLVFFRNRWVRLGRRKYG